MFKETKFRSSSYALILPEQKKFAHRTIITRALQGSDRRLSILLAAIPALSASPKARSKLSES